MANFNVCFPDTPFQSVSVITSHSSASGLSAKNLVTGGRPEYNELATATADDLTVEFDMGAGKSSTASYLALLSAKMLKGGGCSRITLRGSNASAFSPGSISALKLWLDANRGVTTVSGGVTQWNDLSGLGNSATQGTAANRPILSRGDNLDNRLIQSENFSSASWVKDGTSFSGGVLLETATTAIHRQYQSNIPLQSGILHSVTVRAKAKDRNYILIQVDNFSTYYYGVCFDISTGAVGNKRNGSEVASVTAVGDGSFDCTLFFTPPATTTWTVSVFVNNTNSATLSNYAGNSSFGVYLYRSQLKASTSDAGYVASDAFSQYPGMNGNRALLFDGSNDTFATSLAVNPTGGMWALWATKLQLTVADARFFNVIAGGSNDRLFVRTNTTGSVTVSIYNGISNSISRSAPDGTLVSGVTAILSFTYDGTTNATGIKIYKNGVQVDTSSATTGTYTVGGAGDNLNISGSTVSINGYMDDIIYGQGSTLSAGNLADLVAHLTTKHLSTPVYSNNNFSSQTLGGSLAEDFIATFPISGAYRYWQLQLSTDSSSTYPLSKAYFGTPFSFGREPIRGFQLGRSKRDVGERDSRLTADLNWLDIPDSVVTDFNNRVMNWASINPVLLYDAAGLILTVSTMHAVISSYSDSIATLGKKNISITFEELI